MLQKRKSTWVTVWYFDQICQACVSVHCHWWDSAEMNTPVIDKAGWNNCHFTYKVIYIQAEKLHHVSTLIIVISN